MNAKQEEHLAAEPETAKAGEWTDRRAELVIGDLLRVGVIVSAVLVLIGGIAYLAANGAAAPAYHAFRGEPSDLRSVSGIIRDALALHSRGIIQLGLLLLIATPVARVAFSVFVFLRERDRMYVVFTLIVLSLLVYSLAIGHA